MTAWPTTPVGGGLTAAVRLRMMRRPMGLFGTSAQRQETAPPTRADALADMVLPDHEGRDIRLGDLWADQLAVLVWLRHYG